MTRSEALDRLMRYANVLKARGATALYIFGSTIRDEDGADSDLDLFIDYDPNGAFNAFDLVGLKLFLEGELGTEVDLTTRDGLHPMLRANIDRSALRVF